MFVVGKHFPFLLIVVEWLKSKSTELLKCSRIVAPLTQGQPGIAEIVLGNLT